MTSHMEASGGPNVQWPHEDKGQFIRLRSPRDRWTEAGKKENGGEEWHSAFHCGWTHIWWPCVTGAPGLMMGFLRPAQLGQVSPDSQREAEREMTIDMLVTVCASLCI